MIVPTMEPDRRGARRTMEHAHDVDAAWARLVVDAEFDIAPMRPIVRSAAYRAGELRLAVQCRRHAASVRRTLADAMPPYHVFAARVAHP